MKKLTRKIVILLYITIALSVCISAYKNRTEIHEWCKTQIEMCKRDCKIMSIKKQFIRLQQLYGPEGAIEA